MAFDLDGLGVHVVVGAQDLTVAAHATPVVAGLLQALGSLAQGGHVDLVGAALPGGQALGLRTIGGVEHDQDPATSDGVVIGQELGVDEDGIGRRMTRRARCGLQRGGNSFTSEQVHGSLQSEGGR